MNLNIEYDVQQLHYLGLGFETNVSQHNVFNIAPKRPNWDLKGETDKKLAKLERKTQETINTLICK
ncbi:MAG: hypothetical protein NXY57DRAFT_892075 [Lentinula lateritia]|nr:MAG: hypothetical protein NXY57DRAFT_892075 [Lentinula lateritia]